MTPQEALDWLRNVLNPSDAPGEARKALDSYHSVGKPYPSDATLARAAAIVPQDQFASPAEQGAREFSLAAVVAFLDGSAPLDGVWFGERHPTERGGFWWRKHLRAAVAETDAPLATGRVGVAVDDAMVERALATFDRAVSAFAAFDVPARTSAMRAAILESLAGPLVAGEVAEPRVLSVEEIAIARAAESPDTYVSVKTSDLRAVLTLVYAGTAKGNDNG
jgi:hypothetical protein